MNVFWSVFWKEWIDALRDRRTLLTVFLSSVAMGPLVLVLLSNLIGSMERRAEAREILVVGMDSAPTLRNYLERQTYVIKAPPADYERLLKDSHLGDPVVVVPSDFEDQLAAGETPRLEVVSASANQRAQASVGRLLRVLHGFNQERAGLQMGLRGLPLGGLTSVKISERDLSTASARAAQLTSMLPFFILMALIYGSLAAALDTTAGERERGSLEPLLMNPASRLQLVMGKWAAVSAVGWVIGVLSCFSFLPGQWLLRSETLAAMFRYSWPELAWFVLLLTPLVGALAAVLMAVAIRCKSVKEAQANSAMVMMAASMLPMLAMFSQEGEQGWHKFVPVLAQFSQMGRVLRGDELPWLDVLWPALVCAGWTGLCLMFVARVIPRAAIR